MHVPRETGIKIEYLFSDITENPQGEKLFYRLSIFYFT